ncbi:MAG: hypothetical protein R3C05_11885 [Pirellulaceae bacterium]
MSPNSSAHPPTIPKNRKDALELLDRAGAVRRNLEQIRLFENAVNRQVIEPFKEQLNNAVLECLASLC